MQILRDIDKRLQKNDEDVDDQVRSYRRNEKKAYCVAQTIPLIHVSGGRVSFEQVLDNRKGTLPTSQDMEYYSDETRHTEQVLKLQPSLYTYAGRACPDFGSVALGFNYEIEKGRKGSATPFDTGGLLHPKRYIKVNLSPDTEEKRAEYAKKSVVSLKKWREHFARFLAAFFDPVTAYWGDDPPTHIDPENLLCSENHWRAWTFEVRFNDELSIIDSEAWSCSPGVWERLRRRKSEQPVRPPSRETCLDKFFQKSRLLTPRGSPDYCKEIENWAQKQAI